MIEKALGIFKNTGILRMMSKGSELSEASPHHTDILQPLQKSQKSKSVLSVFSKQQEKQDQISHRALLDELDATLKELRYARSCFENASDPEIVDACVYEIKSAEARYSFLLRKAKECGASRTHAEQISR